MTPPLLSILCITKGEPHAEGFLDDMWQTVTALPFEAELLVIVDGSTTDADRVADEWLPRRHPHCRIELPPITLQQGFFEALYHDSVQQCRGDYILRLDDDERINRPMYLWLAQQGFRLHDHWKFDRAHLWGDQAHYINEGPLWPDHQTRLSIKAKAGGRKTIHAGSPFGGGELAPQCVIEHHCFLVRDCHERVAKMARYNQIQLGAGWPIFHIPESVYADKGVPVPVADYSPLRHPDAPV